MTPDDASTLHQAEKAIKTVAKFPCPRCGEWSSEVRDGRPAMDGYRRKRRCLACGETFFTLEKISRVA